ncbi:hypothetical protein DB30_03766 [Enhygromyxa salina]|uniref:Uncharacterized protein n=1 Tax=Enhygromyxa salina TaxID=215803 RepID=A0A0C1ZHU9_9BACT|nr:hypothetical protein DB30_03766 [Enhygromyxa salina]
MVLGLGLWLFTRSDPNLRWPWRKGGPAPTKLAQQRSV